MRQSENAKSNYAPKAFSTVQIGMRIRLPTKKIYCSKCQELVRGQMEGAGDTTKVSCPKCLQRLWYRGSLSWRSKGKEMNISP